MYQGNGYFRLPRGLRELSHSRPDAVAKIVGGEEYPELGGRVWFYGQEDGVLVVSELWGLPVWEDACSSPVFGFHIHEGATCEPMNGESFEDAGGHYNPNGCEHPMHAGDLPPLFGNDGYALSAVLTNRFTVHEVIGRTVVVHAMPDDFQTQPAGNAGKRIACGEIVKFGR